MPPSKIPEREFIDTIRAIGPYKASQKWGVNWNNVNQRRSRLERKLHISIEGPNGVKKERTPTPRAAYRLEASVQDGTVLIASDAHYWPGETSLMHKAFVFLCKELKPKLVILNGDVMDFPSISRHAPIGWEHRPKVIDEIEWAQEKTHEIVQACERARKIWTLGNHDARYESRLATLAPEYARVHGVHLKDSFPLWEPGWSVWINSHIVVKHRFRGGIHAVHNNILWAGKSMITGHLHSAKVIPFTDYNGTRWGVDTGCLADPEAQAFADYTEDNPKNWRSAFVVLTFKEGKLLQPELVLKWDAERVEFRGRIFTP